jgi:hypothetical protein
MGCEASGKLNHGHTGRNGNLVLVTVMISTIGMVTISHFAIPIQTSRFIFKVCSLQMEDVTARMDEYC